MRSLGLIVACIMSAAISAQASLIVQGPGGSYVAFEAEIASITDNNGSDPADGFIVVSGTEFTSAFGSDVLPAGSPASGGAILHDSIATRQAPNDTTASYRIQF